jgi:hypothetical protein
MLIDGHATCHDLGLSEEMVGPLCEYHVSRQHNSPHDLGLTSIIIGFSNIKGHMRMVLGNLMYSPKLWWIRSSGRRS